jgi:DNA-binding GntR family transcriptional regulator
MMISTPDKRLAVQAYEQVLGMVMSAEIKPGTVILERRLAEQLTMSRTPVRDALLMLEGEGLLVRNEGRGLQVRYMNIEDFVENLAIRSLLEPEAVRLSIGRISAEQLGGLKARLELLLQQAQTTGTVPDREEVRSVDDDLHTIITTTAGNRHMAGIIRTLRQQTKMFDLRSLPVRLEDTCREHLAIVEALSDNRADDAAEAMRVHLQGVRQSIITHLSNI